MPNWKIAAPIALLTVGLLLGGLAVKNPNPPASRETYASAQKQTATVRTDLASGSAVVFQRNNGYFGGGPSRYFAWTAAHVIEDAQSVQLQTYFRYEGGVAGTALFEATVLAASTNYDLALLWINAPPGTFASAVFANDWSVAAGEQVFACGNFLGRLDTSISVGVVSQVGIISPAKWWAVVDQTTAPIFPGSSGGPLYNSKGEVIGLTVGGYGPVLGLFVPVRAMRAWANEESLEWALQGSSGPSDVELRALARSYVDSITPVVEQVPEAPAEPESEQDGLRSRPEP